jgi:hypothetical protein
MPLRCEVKILENKPDLAAGPIRPVGRHLAIVGLDDRLTDGDEVVSLTRRPCSSPQKYFLVLIYVRG